MAKSIDRKQLICDKERKHMILMTKFFM